MKVSPKFVSTCRLPQWCKLAAIIFSACYVVGCAKPIDIRQEIRQIVDARSKSPYFYILEFDHEGQLISGEEPARAINDLITHPEIDQIVILSLGWNHSRDSLIPEYRKLLNNYHAWKNGYEHRIHLDGRVKVHTAVFAISWESSLKGFGNFIGDIMPLPNSFVSALAKPFLPFTYWAKARLADKIGFGDLKVTFAEILDQVQKGRKKLGTIGLYGVGHSFGTRIITGLFNTSENARKQLPEGVIKGAVLIQPALSSFELHSLGSIATNLPAYPVLVTSSRHDHANRYLFPLANIPLNSAYLRFSGELFKPLIFDEQESAMYSNAYDYVLFPFMIPYSALLFADSYVFGQINEISERSWRYLPDTLSQLPVIEYPVSLINEKLKPIEPDDYWGRRHKGAFYLGSMHESAATIIEPHNYGLFFAIRTLVGDLFNRELAKTAVVQPVTTQARVIESKGMLPNGIIPVDMTEEIDTGAFSEDLSTRPNLTEPIFGWADPIGSHNDYEIPEVYELIYRLLEIQKIDH